MIKKKLMISSLVLLLCANSALFTSCGGNKDTTHDANGNGQVVTENKNDSTDKNKNENGVVGEMVTDVTDGVNDIVGGVTGGVNDIVGGTTHGTDNGMNEGNGTANGGTANGGTMNGGTTNGGTMNGGTTNGGTTNDGNMNGGNGTTDDNGATARGRMMPRFGK